MAYNMDDGSNYEKMMRAKGTTVVGKQKKKIFLPEGERSSFNGMTGIFGFILALLVCFALIRVSMGYQPIYFSSFLDIIEDVPTINFTAAFSNLAITADWGFLNGLRNFINVLANLMSFAVYVTNGLINALIILFYFVKAFFGL